MDSFFGFDATLPTDNDDDNGDIESEGAYDALNSETFGQADRGDWENLHENLVRLSAKESDHDDFKSSKNLYEEHSDLDMNFSKFELDDCDIPSDDLESRVQLDPSVWASPAKSMHPNRTNAPSIFPSLNNFSQPPQHSASNFQNYVAPPMPLNMCTVEDLERNIINQQHKDMHENNKNVSNKQPYLMAAPPPNIRNQMFPPPPHLNHNARLPVGFLPYNFMPPHYGGPMNNLAMHPGFANMGQMPPHPQMQQPRMPFPLQQNYGQNVQNNQFNKRLVQEIQQNHPMLPFNRQNNAYNNHSNNHNNNHNNNHHNNLQQMQNGIVNMADYDEYANLMTNREKQWLIGIQLTQLNSETPYINDFYYTVHKERVAALKGDRESKAYKNNQLNHPFTQPTGHAQLLLMSSLAKNCGLLNQKNNRERKTSESKNNNDNKEPGRTYTPLQFENSLGKLQCGSVTAPRKIIDMDIVASESGNQNNLTTEVSSQRRSKQILLHIEMMYKIVLKMEDLNNPAAIEAALISREKKEMQRLLELEQRMVDDSLNGVSLTDSRSSSLSTAEPENLDELLVKLITGLNQEKVTSMLMVRKGKILLRRILVVIREHRYRWNLWAAIFTAVPYIMKKDRDDPEGVLFALYTEFERHIQYSELTNIIELSDIVKTDKIINHIVSCKFLLSSIITIVFQMEIYYLKSIHTINTVDQDNWIMFLDQLASITSSKLANPAIVVAPQHTIKIDKNNNIIKTISNHFARFKQIKCEDFLNFITECN